jgi:hypothetical protein
MKKYGFFLVIVLSVLMITSCKKTPHDLIKGNWDITKIENSSYSNPEDIAFFDKINSEVLAKEKFVFEEGKISKSMPEATNGSWKMDEKGTKLIIDWGEKDVYSPHTFVIKSLTEDNLVIEEDFEEFTLTTSFAKVK